MSVFGKRGKNDDNNDKEADYDNGAQLGGNFPTTATTVSSTIL